MFAYRGRPKVIDGRDWTQSRCCPPSDGVGLCSRARNASSAHDPFRTQELGGSVHPMFGIFYSGVLIGRSELESGDPPMGVAFGRFEPTGAFAPLRNAMKPVRDGGGKEHRDTRYLVGVSARTADGILLVCSHVEVCEYGEADNPFTWEVSCLGIEHPPYEVLFPHHVKAYEDRFKE
jgi:hypothetical protein